MDSSSLRHRGHAFGKKMSRFCWRSMVGSLSLQAVQIKITLEGIYASALFATKVIHTLMSCQVFLYDFTTNVPFFEGVHSRESYHIISQTNVFHPSYKKSHFINLPIVQIPSQPYSPTASFPSAFSILYHLGILIKRKTLNVRSFQPKGAIGAPFIIPKTSLTPRSHFHFCIFFEVFQELHYAFLTTHPMRRRDFDSQTFSSSYLLAKICHHKFSFSFPNLHSHLERRALLIFFILCNPLLFRKEKDLVLTTPSPTLCRIRS